MKKIIKLALLLLSALLIAFFLFWIYKNFETQDLSPLKKTEVILAIWVAAAFYACVIPASAYSWQQILLAFNDHHPTKKLACIMGATQIAKYAPGNFLQHIGRYALSLKEGMGTKAYLCSVIMELALSVLASAFVFSLISIFLQEGFGFFDKYMAILTAVLIASIGAAVHLLPEAALKKYTYPHSMNLIKLKFSAIKSFSIYSFNYLLVGAGMWFILSAMDLTNEISYGQITAAFCISWLVGLLAPGAPAGLGARETTLILVLNSGPPESSLLALILAMRIATVVGDGLCFAISAFYLVREKREP